MIESPLARRSAGGFSIVEALVALVVLSIGMLGIAALYVESLRAGRSAIYRTQAVNLASDLADRIRANRQAGRAYQLLPGTNPTLTTRCAPTSTLASTNCNRDQLAADDLARWLDAIRDQLPGNGTPSSPMGTVRFTPGTVTNQYSIEVTWSEPGERDPLTYVLNMQI